jgi:GT2 family glycosyltransferase
MIPLLSVNYNTPDLIYNLVKSFRQFYPNDIHIIDGSNKDKRQELIALLQEFDNWTIHPFSGNIHHGMGMAYGFKMLSEKQILILDSDVTVLKYGFIEDLQENLPDNAYGIGDCQFVDDKGYNVGSRNNAHGLKESEMTEGGYRYLHPAIMLINRDIVLQWPMPINHGAPMIAPMIAITNAGKQNLLIHRDWVYNDNRNDKKIYASHPWMGTVIRTGGYNLT